MEYEAELGLVNNVTQRGNNMSQGIAWVVQAKKASLSSSLSADESILCVFILCRKVSETIPSKVERCKLLFFIRTYSFEFIHFTFYYIVDSCLAACLPLPSCLPISACLHAWLPLPACLLLSTTQAVPECHAKSKKCSCEAPPPSLCVLYKTGSAYCLLGSVST